MLKGLLFFGGLVASAAVALVAVKLGTAFLADADGIKDASAHAEEISRARTAVLAVLAGLIASVGAYYTHRSFQLNRQGQITERFTRAVDQLGNESADVRLGGIYALERVARESSDDHGPVMEILTAFVRGHTVIPDEDYLEQMYNEQPEDWPPLPRADVQAALTVIGRRVASHDPAPPWRPDLRACYLPHVNLRDADFRRADLAFSHLLQATATGCDLNSASLRATELAYADFSNAGLQGADLNAAVAFRTKFQRADLRAANFSEARLRAADLSDSILTGADFQQASFSEATKWPTHFDAAAAGAQVQE